MKQMETSTTRPPAELTDEQASRFEKAIDLKNRGRLETALVLFKGLLKEKPENPGLHGMAAHAYWMRGDLERAVTHFRISTLLSPGSELGSLGLFHTLWDSGKVAAAIDEMKRYMSKHHSDEYTLLIDDLDAELGNLGLFHALYQSGRFNDAFEELKKCVVEHEPEE